MAQFGKNKAKLFSSKRQLEERRKMMVVSYFHVFLSGLLTIWRPETKNFYK